MGHRLKRLKLNQPSDADQAAGYLPTFAESATSAMASSEATAVAEPVQAPRDIFERCSRPGGSRGFPTDGQYNTLLHQLHRDRLLRARLGATTSSSAGAGAAVPASRLNSSGLPVCSREVLGPDDDFADLDELMSQSADGEQCDLMSTSQ